MGRVKLAKRPLSATLGRAQDSTIPEKIEQKRREKEQREQLKRKGEYICWLKRWNDEDTTMPTEAQGI